MLHRGVIDSPPDQSQTLRQLEAIEKALRSAEAGDSDDSGFALATQHERVRDELWALLLDVVCSPLWVRLRAAALLNVCFAVREDALRVEHRNAYWIRSIVSSTCQALEELDATERHQEANLFEWLEFLEHVLVATPSEVVRLRAYRQLYYGIVFAIDVLVCVWLSKVRQGAAAQHVREHAHQDAAAALQLLDQGVRSHDHVRRLLLRARAAVPAQCEGQPARARGPGTRRAPRGHAALWRRAAARDQLVRLPVSAEPRRAPLELAPGTHVVRKPLICLIS